MSPAFPTLLLSAAIALGFLALPTQVHAHHSAALYSDDTIELAGELTDIQWQNPHIRFTLKAMNPDGAVKMWHLESSSIFLREQDGVTRELFRIGDAVKVFGRLSRRDATALLATNMLLPDGREAPLWPQARARFVPEDKMIKAGDTRRIDAAAENRGIFRVWLPPLPGSLAALPYTDAALAARKSFDLLAFSRRCEPEGMPRIMHTNVFPREFIDRGSEIVLKTELFDTQRTIHMDHSAPPPAERPSRLGYSIGAWEGGQLVVRTTLVNWPYFDAIGTPQSDKVEITERFAVSEDQSRLNFEMTVVDPATFKAPAVIKIQWVPFAGSIQRYDCQAER